MRQRNLIEEGAVFDWLEEEPANLSELVVLIASTILFTQIFSAFAAGALDLLGVLGDRPERVRALLGWMFANPVQGFIYAMWQMMREELLSRIIPLSAAVVIGRMWQNKWLIPITFVCFSVVFFGWSHGGPQFIFLQGISGGAYGLVFLKCGGLRGGVGLLKASILTYATHVSNNTISLLLWLLIGGLVT